MRRLIAVIVAFGSLFFPVLLQGQGAINATWYVGGTVAYTCILNDAICNVDLKPTACNPATLQQATLFIKVPGIGNVPSDCGPDLACTCWMLKIGTPISVYGKLYPIPSVGLTLNRVTSISSP